MQGPTTSVKVLGAQGTGTSQDIPSKVRNENFHRDPSATEEEIEWEGINSKPGTSGNIQVKFNRKNW